MKEMQKKKKKDLSCFIIENSSPPLFFLQIKSHAENYNPTLKRKKYEEYLKTGKN